MRRLANEDAARWRLEAEPGGAREERQCHGRDKQTCGSHPNRGTWWMGASADVRFTHPTVVVQTCASHHLTFKTIRLQPGIVSAGGAFVRLGADFNLCAHDLF